MVSFRCHDNSDLVATLIITNFHLYLIQLWWQFFQMFVYGDVVYAQTWQVLILKIKLYRVASYGPRSFQLFCKNLGNLQEFFGKMVHRPPPPGKNYLYAYVTASTEEFDDKAYQST